jgi:hypothetical protein
MFQLSIRILTVVQHMISPRPSRCSNYFAHLPPLSLAVKVEIGHPRRFLAQPRTDMTFADIIGSPTVRHS